MVAKLARLEDLMIGERQPAAAGGSRRAANIESAADTLSSGRDTLDTIPDEESGLKPVSQHPGNLVERHLQQYRGTAISIVDAEVHKQKFRYSLFKLLKNDFLKPIFTAISADASPQQIQALSEERKTAFDDYLKILSNPTYMSQLSEVIMLQLSILSSMGDWKSIDGINYIKIQIAEILETPIARPT